MMSYATKTAMKEAGMTPSNFKVCELHDYFSANEMVMIDALGLSSLGRRLI